MPTSSPSTSSAEDVRPTGSERPPRLLRWLRNAIAVLIVYGNVAVALQPHALRRMGVRVPRPAWMHDAFLMTGMFGSYSLTNSDFELLGLRTHAGAPGERGRWIGLRLRDHFAQRHGVVFTQLYAAHHWDVHGKAAQQRAFRFLARKIRERHNRLHPDREIARVRIGSVQWPQSALGYRAGKQAARLKQQTWFSEDAR